MKHDHKVLSGPQILAACLFATALIVLTAHFGWYTWATTLFIAHVYFFATSLFKAYLSYLSLRNNKVNWVYPSNLTMYTVIVPLYKEANMIPKIINNLSKLKYPSNALEIMITLESDDQETIQAYHNSEKPDFFKLVVVPDGFPKTKPRACNYALEQSTGEFVTIYDAEDAPEPWQLIKSVSLFEQYGPKVAVLQAGLNYFNYKENLLTRLFAIEYTHWFWFMLPGLSFNNLPIPLGGTSNHFRSSVLKSIGGWNPFNVTEDAEIGIRIASLGYDAKYLPSHTWEEAVKKTVPWIKQRTRWSKGYMQTWLTYSRSGSGLYKTRGIKAGLVMSLFVLGTPLCALLTLPLYFIFASWVLFDPAWIQSLFPTQLHWQLSWACLFVGNVVSIISAMWAVVRVGGGALSLFAMLLPVYWVLHSIAAWRAVYQLIVDPYKWEKTQHGVTKISHGSNSPKQ